MIVMLILVLALWGLTGFEENGFWLVGIILAGLLIFKGVRGGAGRYRDGR